MSALERQLALAAQPPITEFTGEHAFLSNFQPGERLRVPECWGWGYEPHGWLYAQLNASWCGAMRVYSSWRAVHPHGLDVVEIPFQAAKATSIEDVDWILESKSPKQAKDRGSVRGEDGRKIELRPDWEQVKVPIMLCCLRQKFAPGSPSAKRLIATSPRVLVEGNTWRDTTWGVYEGAGRNLLGRCLMLVRQELTLAVAAGVEPRLIRG